MYHPGFHIECAAFLKRPIRIQPLLQEGSLPVLWLFANHGWDSPLGPFPLLSSFPVSMVAGSESKCIVISLEQGLACYLMNSWAA